MQNIFFKHNEIKIINSKKTGKSKYFKVDENENISKCVKISYSIVSREIYSVKRLKISNLRFHF